MTSKLLAALFLLFAYWIYRLHKEVTARRCAEAALRQSEAKLLAILEAEPECVKITDADGRLTYMNRAGLAMTEAESGSGKRAFFDNLLRTILEQTESAYGFIGEVQYTANHAPQLKIHAISGSATDEKNRASPPEDAPQNLALSNPATLTGKVISSGQAVLVNDLQQDSKDAGLPPGHPPLNAFLGLPLFYSGLMLGMVGIANRTGGYDAKLLEELQPLLSTCGNLIAAYRNNKARERAEEALRQSHARYDELAARIPIGVYTYRIRTDGVAFEYVNPRFCELLGLDRGAVLRDAGLIFSTVHPDELKAHLALSRECAKTLAPFLWEGRFIIAGEIRWLCAQATGKREDNGDSVWNGIVIDITERKKNEERLILASRVFSEAREGILITDAEGAIVDVNPTYCEITGYSRTEAIGKNPGFLKSGRQSREFYADMWKELIKTGHWQGEIWNNTKSGELYAEWLTISALRDETGKTVNYIGLFSDVTQFKLQQQALEMMAHYDPLTGLPNRLLFADRFTQAVTRCKRDNTLLGICYLDLDGFKPVNDTYGHEIGDRLLNKIAERIKANLREEDTSSRLGGDEFALMLVALESLEQFESALARIHNAIAEPIQIGEHRIAIAASSGGTLYPDDDNDLDTLLRHADQAMYQAKSAGRNCYRLFDPAQDQQLQTSLQTISLIQQAFSRHEFCLYYQPKVNIKTAKVVGVEALIRWNHPERGILSPAEFLSFIEASELEIALGNWAIETCLKQLEDWQRSGLNIQISLNISPHHLLWKDFIKELDAALCRHPQVRSDLLELEVLESSILVDSISACNALKECTQTLGVPFALDDFGTGYSSLAHLRRFPVSTVKIDQSFVRDMLDDIDDLAIVQGVIGLTQAFKREVIAEGVETMEHGLVLLAVGCNVAQGHGIAQAMPGSTIPEWVRNYRPYAEWLLYARNPLSHMQAQLLLLKIEMEQFVARFAAQLLSPQAPGQRWPLMNPKKSHLANWIIQSRKDAYINQDLLDSLQHAHEKLLLAGNRLKQQHHEGKIEAAAAEIEALNATQREITAILERL